jgi:hypothetical protein
MQTASVVEAVLAAKFALLSAPQIPLHGLRRIVNNYSAGSPRS